MRLLRVVVMGVACSIFFFVLQQTVLNNAKWHVRVETWRGTGTRMAFRIGSLHTRALFRSQTRCTALGYMGDGDIVRKVLSF